MLTHVAEVFMGSKSGDRRAVNSGQVKRGELWPVQVGPLRRREAEGARWRPPAPLIETRSIAARDVVSGGYRMEARRIKKARNGIMASKTLTQCPENPPRQLPEFLRTGLTTGRSRNPPRAGTQRREQPRIEKLCRHLV